MAVDFMSYLRSVENPMDSFGQGMEQGARIKAIRAQEQAANAAAQDIAAKQQAQRQQQQAIGAFIQQSNKTAQDYADMMMQYPELSAGFKTSYDTMEEGEQKKTQRDAVSVYAALENGQSDIAESILDERIRLAEQRGDTDGAQGSKIIKQMLKVNPEAAKTTAGFFLSHALGGDGMADVMATFGKEQRESDMHPAELRIKQQQAVNTGLDAGLKQATINKVMAETRQLGANTAKTVMEMEKARDQNGGVIPDKDKPAFETNLRKEATALLKTNRAVKKSRDQMVSILNNTESGADLGVADVGAIVTFFKTIDPTSTVTATESGLVEGAEGVFGKFAAVWNKAVNEGKFTDNARKALIDASERIYAPARKEAEALEKKYAKIATDYGVDPERVLLTDFTEPEAKEPGATEELFTPDPNSPYSEKMQRMRFEHKKKSGTPVSSVDSNFLNRVAQAESGGNPNATTTAGSASGLFGFTDATWRSMVKKYGDKHNITVADKNDPDAQRVMAEILTEENRRALVSKGIEPSEGDLYVAHFMGAGQGARLIKRRNSNASAVETFPKEAKSNRPIFYGKSGNPRTIAQVYDILTGKV